MTALHFPFPIPNPNKRTLTTIPSFHPNHIHNSLQCQYHHHFSDSILFLEFQLNSLEMTPIPNPEVIHYACIARATTILCHHLNAGDPNIETLASQCIAQTPPNHSLFSHTLKNRTYTFLIHPPFVFFAIFDHHQLLKPHALLFLHRLRSQFQTLIQSHSQTNHDFSHLSFQPQFHSIFRDALHSPNDAVSRNPCVVDSSPKGKRSAAVPLLGKIPVEGLKKKKKRVVEPNGGIDCKDASLENKVEVCDEVNGFCGRDLSLLVPKGAVNDRQKAKHIWKKHVWVVLLLDLFVCSVLFVIWLWVCSGFKCMTY